MTWLSKLRTPGFTASISLLCVAANAHAAALPSAGQVFERYVRATGGESAWRSKRSERDEIEGRALGSNRVILRATLLHTRSGNALHQIHAPEEASEGVYNGIAWAWTKLSGPRIKHGVDRDEAIRAARMLEEADWRRLFPKSRVADVEEIEGRRCYRVSMLPSDEGRAEWFDAETGLLVKQETLDSVSTVESWLERDGLKQPASLLITRGDLTYRLTYLNVSYNDVPKPDSLRYPATVEQYLAAERAGTALPNAEEIIERHIFESGGSPAYEKLKTQKVTGTLDFISRNVAARTEAWSGGDGRYYQLLDSPGLGKEEQGSDGRVAWERSSVLGPRARPRKSGSDLGLTLDAAEVIGWRYMVGEVRTEAEETIDGHDCYRVRLTGRDAAPAAIRWYDRTSGLLYRTSLSFKTEMGPVPAVMTYEAYRLVEGIRWPVRIHMTISGQEMVFHADEVALNSPIDEAVFQLPEEIQQLADMQEDR